MPFAGRHHPIPYTITGFVGALLAILCESKGRRRELALYMTNITSDVVFRMLQSRGYVRPIRYGETIIFALAMAVLSCVAQTQLNALGSFKMPSRAVFGDPKAPDTVEKAVSDAIGTYTKAHMLVAFLITL
jgi:hypothetical protein